jgi:hypothetical protein
MRRAQIAGGIGAAAILAVLAIGAASFIAPKAARRAADPQAPIAADGSMVAGRSRTFFDMEPAYRDPPPSNPDDPKEFEQRIKDDKRTNDRSREPIIQLLGGLDRTFCENARHKLLIAATQLYYRTRSREKQSFAIRGPRAKAAMEKEWSTPLDRRIDDFVRAALVSGFLHKDDFPASVYPEFVNVFAATDDGPDACPRKL